MKKSVTIFILAFIVVSFSIAMYYLYSKNAEDPVVYKTEKPIRKTIIKETVATGSIVPLEEVLIKPNISGVIQKVYVKGGDYVKKGDLIAKIKIIPNLSLLNSAKNEIKTSQISLNNEKGIISKQDFEKAEVAYQQAEESYDASHRNFDIVRTGSTRGLGNTANTLIRSTVSGMVLDIPVEVGNQVIESNNFNEGTTIAALADVNKLIFKGKVDESEVGKIKVGLPLEITIGAVENTKFDATLDYIAPKGKLENGAIQFEIEGTLKKQDNVFIRVGLSANASIILAKADSVISINEALVQFDPKTKAPFVEVKTGNKEFERKDIKLGISDGIFVEVKGETLSLDDKIKVWNKIEKKEKEDDD